jgi:hypothetical protein
MYFGDQERMDRDWTDTQSDNEENKRRHTERRIQESKGYTYISMVGWMDRREKKRRQDDFDAPW